MWSLNRENELALHRTEMRMISWMCGVKLRDKLSCVELKQRLGIQVTKVVQTNRLRWYGCVMLVLYLGLKVKICGLGLATACPWSWP